MTMIENFKDLDDIDGYKIFSDTLDNIIFFELEQIPDTIDERIHTFIGFIAIQNTETEMY